MLEVSQFGTVAGLAVVVGVLIQVLKRSFDAAHTALIPWFALTLGVFCAVLYSLTGERFDVASVANAVLTGVAGGLVAVGGYEASTAGKGP